ncbi:MAG: iron-containing alcohol dehydrogenase, partial [Planctomycetia bacterium]|nr:iron-containing alcohol dehydrogenase [Planctomycetia bacterium]
HLEGVGQRTIGRWPLPVVAVPTTAGTGAEATRNAVIACPRRRFKKSMRSPLMVPRAAVIDAELGVDCDHATTAAAGLDAITQLIESFVCRFARPVPRALVLDALPRALAALPRALADRADVDARAALAHAAFLSGVALANSGLGMAHGVAAALGIECGTPHGLACAVMLPTATTTASSRPSRGSAARAVATWSTVGSPADTATRAVSIPAAASDASIRGRAADSTRLRVPPTSQARRPSSRTTSPSSATRPAPKRTIGGMERSYAGSSAGGCESCAMGRSRGAGVMSGGATL